MDFDGYDSIQLLSISEIIENYYQMLKKAMEATALQISGVSVLLTHVHRVTASFLVVHSFSSQKNAFDGSLPEDVAKDLVQFCEKNHMSPFSQALAELLMYLEWHNEKKTPEIEESAVYNALLRLEKAIVSNTSSWELYGQGYDGPDITLTHFEMNMIEQNFSLYIMDLLNENSQEVLFFPLSGLDNSDVLVKWRIFEKIAGIKISPAETIYKQKLKECIRNRIKVEVSMWFEKEFQKLKLAGKCTILKDIDSFTKSVADLTSHVAMAIDVIASEGVLFEEAGCRYFDILSETIDEKLYPLCQLIMEFMDAYQTSHKSFHVNIRDSCALSHALYLQLKKLVHLLTSSEKRLSLQSYNSLFSEVFMHLLQVLKSECHHRIKRAVECELKDTIHSEEKIYSSSVIVLNCFCTIIDEWKHMEIDDEELQIAFLVKLTDIVCDGAKICAEALENRQQKNLQMKDLDYTKKACIIANSIEHIRQYLIDLPELMQWSVSTNVLKGDITNASLKEQVLRILNLIHQSMNTHLQNIAFKLLNLAVTSIQMQLEKPLYSWLQSQNPHQSFDKFMNFLNCNLELLNDFLKPELFADFSSYLWTSIITSIQSGFQEGFPPEYAKAIKVNTETLKDFFSYINMTQSNLHEPLLEQLMDLVEINSKSTVELQLEYYSQIAATVISPVEYLGHIAFQAGYKTIAPDIVDLYINVQKGQRLPARKLEMSELYVKVDLCPSAFFPNQVPFKTPPVTEDLDNPVFNGFFQFSKLPASVLSVKGAVIQVLVLNQDHSYSAEAVLLLNQVQNMSGLSSLEFLPVYLMPLKKFDMSHTCYQVIESRSRWDKTAKTFINKRAKPSKGQKMLLPCISRRRIMCNSSNYD
ncbi:uncharacterized protein LOC129220266 [Uloborus diversus]|uniref:uncharacterized protein LOC129220266 n=1 Tax=Uloborus diversus TaxID=327109 RepID=UPI002409F045|nr:uncharacterized protein LOC129220266 [Uloborus diversus]